MYILSILTVLSLFVFTLLNIINRLRCNNILGVPKSKSIYYKHTEYFYKIKGNFLPNKREHEIKCKIKVYSVKRFLKFFKRKKFLTSEKELRLDDSTFRRVTFMKTKLIEMIDRRQTV